MFFDLNRGLEKQRPGCRILTSPQEWTGRVEGGLPLNLSELRISQKTLSGKTMGIGKGTGVGGGEPLQSTSALNF